MLPDEIWNEIFDWLPIVGDIRDWFHINLVCKRFHVICDRTRNVKKKFYTNHLAMLLKKLPDKPWNWDILSQNPNSTWNLVSRNPDKPWVYRDIIAHSDVTWEIISNEFSRLLSKKEDWIYLSTNPNITWEII